MKNMNVREYRDPLKLAQDISLNRTKVLLLWEMEKRKQNDQGLRNAISNADWKKDGSLTHIKFHKFTMAL